MTDEPKGDELFLGTPEAIEAEFGYVAFPPNMPFAVLHMWNGDCVVCEGFHTREGAKRAFEWNTQADVGYYCL